VPSRALLQALVLVFAGTYLVFFATSHQPLDDVIKPLGAAGATAALFVLALEHYLWRAPLVGGLITNRPDMRGTWRGTLQSDWTDPESGEAQPADDDVYLVVHQTYWSVTARLLTAESRSEPLVGIIEDVAGRARLLAIYRNEPRSALREHSPIHHGAVILDCSGRPPLRLTGAYWTDRRTGGELCFDEHVERQVGDHRSARELFGQLGVRQAKSC
jgi:hypothetical protein